MATTVLEESTPPTRVIYSNVKEIVEQGHYSFDIMWKNAVPAERRISEIEQSIERYKTRIIDDPEEISEHMFRLVKESGSISIVSEYGGMQFIHKNFFDLYVDAAKRYSADGEGIRWVLAIEQDNVELVKVFLEAGIRIRHAKNLAPINFAVGDARVYATVERMEEGRMVQNLLTSNEPAYVDHFKAIFDELWYRGIDATERLRELSRGVEAADLEIISNPAGIMKRAWKIIRSAEHEVLLLLIPTENALRRQVKMGFGEILKELTCGHDPHPRVRIMIPTTASSKVIEETRRDIPSIELVTLNEKLLYDRLSEKELLEKEFTNVAAHELRNSIQPILGLTEVLHSQVAERHAHAGGANCQKPFPDKTSRPGSLKQAAGELSLCEAISRNAVRLGQLADNILDLAKIENQSLKLNYEDFDIDEIISQAVEATRLNIRLAGKPIKLHHPRRKAIIRGDKVRITQVVQNLLANAVKFTERGRIEIAVSETAEGGTVRVRDMGKGISKDAASRLFQRFFTTSTSGSGLGLYISYKIIKAHGGTIGGVNNSVAGSGSRRCGKKRARRARHFRFSCPNQCRTGNRRSHSLDRNFFHGKKFVKVIR